MFCENCGSELSGEFSFCTNCGKKIETSSALETQETIAVKPPAHKTAKAQRASNPAPLGNKPYLQAALSALLGLLLFAAALTVILVTAVRPGNIPKIISNSNIRYILDGTDLSEKIARGLNSGTQDNLNVNGDDISEFLNRDEVSEQLGEIALKYVDAVTMGDYDYYVTPKEFVSFLKSVSSAIEDEFNYKLTSEDYERMLSAFNENDSLKQFGVARILDDADISPAVPYVLFSRYLPLICGLLCALLVLDIFLLHRGKIRAAFLVVGIPTALTGLICIISCLLFGKFPDIFSNSSLYPIIAHLSGLALVLTAAGLISFALGILAIAIFLMIRKIRKNDCSQRVTKSKKIRLAGLIANGVILAACGILVFLCLHGVPEVYADQHDNIESSAAELTDEEEISSASALAGDGTSPGSMALPETINPTGKSDSVRQVAVPSLIGMQMEDAERVLNALDLTARLQFVDSSEPLGIVLEQDLFSDTYVDINTEILLKVSLGTSGSASAASISDEDYILPYSSVRELTDDDLRGLTKDELRIARNEIYARYGRQFNDESLNNYFNSKSWYVNLPKLPANTDPTLTKLELANLDKIKAYEAR